VGNAGLDALSILSAGTTMTAGYTTFQPVYNPLNQAYAGRFNLAYVVAGSTLEDIYTEGISGEVIGRDGNTLTLQGSTLFLNTADTFAYELANTRVLLGPGTIVTADDNSALTGLNTNAVSVGQHIAVRGIYDVLSDGTIQVDATGTSATNTGSVRLQPTALWGQLVSSAPGNLEINLQSIDGYPVGLFDFAGNGSTTAHNPAPASFSVATPGLALPAGTAIGDPVWVSGLATAFGTAPPDFRAFAVNNESSIQVAGAQLDGGASTAPGIATCGIGSQVCEPASLEVVWRELDAAPFESISRTGFSLKLNDPSVLDSAVIRIGPEAIDLTTLPSSPLIVPTTLPVTQTFSPRYAWGVPATASTTATVTSTTALNVSSVFADLIDGVSDTLNTVTHTVLQLQATGLYNRSTNTFTATSINFVL
jgi:hypothetical protein